MGRVFIVCFFISLSLFATDIKTKKLSNIKEIRAEYAVVNSELKGLKKSHHILEGLSLESGEVTLYKNSSGDIRFADIQLFSEMYKSEYKCYFKNNLLFFIYEAKTEYNEPIYSEGFDIKKSIKRVNRFYFIDESLIKWLDENKKEISSSDRRFKSQENMLLSIVREAVKR